MSNEQVSITEAAKRLGINRSRLNQLINKNGVQKTKKGRASLVNYYQVQNLVQTLAATGHIRTPTGKNQVKQNEDNTFFSKLYQEQIRDLQRERDQLKEKLEAVQSENIELRGELKLLKPSPEEQRKPEYRNLFHKLGNAWDLISN